MGVHEITSSSLTEQVSITQDIDATMSDEAWIEVIQRMDEVYADLIISQVELEEKNTELEEAHQFIESVLSSMHDALAVTNINGQIQRINLALEKLIGKSSVELRGKPLHVLFPKSEVKQVSEFPEKIRTGDLVDCELEMLNEQGGSVLMAITCKAHYDYDGRLIGSVLTGRPLDEIRQAYRKLKETHEELKETQQQLIQSEKMASLGRLIAGVAHELNNPISFVFGNMYALQSYEKKFRKYLNSIHQNIDIEERDKLRKELKIDHIFDDIKPLLEGSMEGAQRVSAIVQELRHFATPKYDEMTSFDLISLVNSSIHWVTHSARNKPAISKQLPESLYVTTNEGYIHQILINLLQNALDTMEDIDDPVLDINVAEMGKNIQISVRDNGAGISKHNLLRVFDPFFTTKDVGKGTGLGLYISYKLATEQCNGSLQVKNHPDGGAIFQLSFPQS